MTDPNNRDNSRHYAIYGGSFDPVHVGHIALAEHAVTECGIDKLIFMPAYVSPFKQDREVTCGNDRAAMIDLILGCNKSFCLSRYELGQEGPSYTYETLRHWKALLGGELSFVLGLDSVMDISKWYHGEDILREYHLITAFRPDSDDAAGMKRIEEYRSRYGASITVLKMPPVDASSTEIRSRVREGREIAGMVTPEVERYIAEHDLYKNR